MKFAKQTITRDGFRSCAIVKREGESSPAFGDFRWGDPGDVAPVGEGISEMRINYGPGYRVYFTEIDAAIFVLLIGGNKKTQARDVRKAKELARNL
jgi:putative addiction module killer protein